MLTTTRRPLSVAKHRTCEESSNQLHLSWIIGSDAILGERLPGATSFVPRDGD